MALVILGIAAAGVLLPFSSGAAVQAEGTHRALGVRLASDLMERIVSTPRDEIAARWNGYVEEEGEITDAGGFPFTDSLYERFRREVVCVGVYTAQQSGAPLAPSFLRASVQVYYQGRPVAAVSRLIGR